MSVSTELIHDNPMWDAVREHVRADDYYGFRSGGLCVGGLGNYDPLIRRTELASRFAWTITSPETVAFVAEHLDGWAIDPLAGSGYWTYLLAQCGVDVAASDRRPPVFDQKHNQWHHHGAHWTVRQSDAVDAVRAADPTRSLLLSWPPYDNPIGAEVMKAFKGDRIVYIGESDGGCCGDDDMFALLDQNWAVVAEHRPVQFWGIHDHVTVYDRKAGDA